MDISAWMIGSLFLVGLVAGFVDAIAGGGGVLTLPALLLSGLPPHLALGTNKGQGVFGTAMSLHRFAASDLLHRRRAWQSFPPAVLAAMAGALTVSKLAEKILTPVVMVLLVAVAIFMLIRRPRSTDLPPRRRSALLAILVAAILAYYDGFFGPGTGTFLIIAYAWLWHDPLDAASANAKVVNFGSNLGAMLMFAYRGLIVWQRAAPMALGQAIGGYLGAHLTIKIGRSLVRCVVILASLAIIGRLAWKIIHG